MSQSREQIMAVLKEIQDSVPDVIKKNIVNEIEITPTIRKVALEAMESGSTRPELKEKLKILLDSGELSRSKYTENKKYVDMANNMVSRLIKKAIKEGRLPKKFNNSLK